MHASSDRHRRDMSSLVPELEPVQLLDPDGRLVEHPEYSFDLDDDALRRMYRLMVVTRVADREAINLQRQGQLAVYASCLGQEAAQVGSALAHEQDDWIFPSYRELGVALTREVDLVGLMHMFRGTWLSDHDPYDKNFGLLTISIGTQTLHAAGFAMGTALDARSTVTTVYLGDGATSEGDAHEAMTFAGVFRAPIVFFVQNNQYAISVPIDRQTAAPSLAHKAVGYGMPGIRCDGNDVLASYAVTQRAIEAARNGEGPCFIEAVTYRREAHTTSDDASRYRSDEELEQAVASDPIARLRRLLERRDVFDEELERSSDEQGHEVAARMREAIFEAPHGDPMELFEHVYDDGDGHFDDQPWQLAAKIGGETR